MNSRITLFSYLLLLLVAIPATAQKKNEVLGIPEAFKYPIDPGLERTASFANRTEDQDKRKEWIVYSDRNDNPVFDSPNGTPTGHTLAFKEYFLVVDNEPDWIRIAAHQGVSNLRTVGDLEVLGWVHKSHMLLWSSALRDDKTKIERKAFLLNRKEEVLRDRNLDLQTINDKSIYDHPVKGRKIKDTRIYKFYFVYKKAWSDGTPRFLIASDSRFRRPQAAKEGIVGWVSKRDLAEWNTNLCLEPNFDPMAFAERKASEGLKVRTYLDSDALKGASKTTIGPTEAIYVDADGSDVVDLAVRQRAKSDPYRHKGNVLRFPYLTEDRIGNTPFYVTGQIGTLPVGTLKEGISSRTISEVAMSNLNSAYVEMQKALDRLNIFFVIDGTSSMAPQQEELVEALRSLKKNAHLSEIGRDVKYGAVIYRKPELGEHDIDLLSPTSDLKALVDFVAEIDFKNDFGGKVSNAPGTIVKYGVEQAIRHADFSREAMNQLIIIGKEGDMSMNPHFHLPEAYDVDESLSQIKKDATEMKIAIHSIQLSNDDTPMDKGFRSGTFEILYEAAKYQHNQEKNLNEAKSMVSNGKLDEPVLERMKGEDRYYLSGHKPGMCFYPQSGGQMSRDSLVAHLHEAIDVSVSQRELSVNVLDQTIGRRKEYDQEGFSTQFGVKSPEMNYAAYTAFLELAERSGVDLEDLLKSFDQKLDLFTQVYIPVQPEGAVYPSCKFVVFMTAERLAEYKHVLKRALRRCQDNDAGTDVKRNAVREMLLSLLENFTGETNFDELTKTFDDLDQDQYSSKVKSIEAILAMETLLIADISTIRKKSKVSNKEIQDIIDRYDEVYQKLEKMTKTRTSEQDFVFETVNNKYYWLRLDEIF